MFFLRSSVLIKSFIRLVSSPSALLTDCVSANISFAGSDLPSSCSLNH